LQVSPSGTFSAVQSCSEQSASPSEQTSAGEKFADADLIGIPWRVVVSEKSLESGGVEVKKRSEEKSEIVKEKELLKKIK
jgi:prolyl-tRNA synthetase